MSGGSFNYLGQSAIWGDITGSLPIETIDRMALALHEYPGGAEAAARTRNVLALIDNLREEMRELGPIWKAVEWHHSCDWGEDAVINALNGKGAL